MPSVLVPPIKCQGIKTKLVPVIVESVRDLVRQFPQCASGRWIEPFLGSGVVGLNIQPEKALLADLNPHLIRFYHAVQSGDITPEITRNFLQREGKSLATRGEEHYYAVRARFNEIGNPLDFLFLSRACFNGLIRFNRRGAFNVPFCRKPDRFAPAYVTKIVNQVAHFRRALEQRAWEFRVSDFESTVSEASEDDIIYCDPPYLGRHVDYFDSWTRDDEDRLFQALFKTKAKFLLSTWHSNRFRENEMIKTHWGRFSVQVSEHFYHIGASESNRHPMLEAVVTNFDVVPFSRERFQQHVAMSQMFRFG